MAYEMLRYSREGKIVTITLNRPERRNALNKQLRDEISAALAAIEADGDASVAIITGAGDVFCAGFDTSEFATTPPEEVFASESSRRYHWQLQNFAKPLVAAVNGAAMGGGCDIAVLADVRVAADTASFGQPQVKFGAGVAFGPLAAIVGGGVARELCLTGRRVSAQEALTLGLVNRVVPAGELLAEARKVASEIAEAPLAALMRVKAAIIEASTHRYPGP